MPTVKLVVNATTTDAMANNTFNVIPPGGAIINGFFSGATVDDAVGLKIGDRDIMVQGTTVNIEEAADVCNCNGRDQLIFNEVVGPGQLYMPVTVTTELQAVLHIRYLAGR